jgi:hypothetical protein
MGGRQIRTWCGSLVYCSKKTAGCQNIRAAAAVTTRRPQGGMGPPALLPSSIRVWDEWEPLSGGGNGAARTIPTEANAVRASATDRATDRRACFLASSGSSSGGEILVVRCRRGGRRRGRVREADVRQRPTERPATEERAGYKLDGGIPFTACASSVLVREKNVHR